MKNTLLLLTFILFSFSDAFALNNESLTSNIIDESNATIYYNTPFCQNSSPQTVTINGDGNYLGGTFSSTSGLAIDSSNGTINPNLSTIGVYIVFYTVAANESDPGFTTSFSVEVISLVQPIFDIPTSICQNENVILPGVSLNGITGTWSPSFDAGVTGTYDFTPDNSNECATSTSLNIIVSPAINPTFNPAPAFICANDAFPVFPSVSNEGITGSWTFVYDSTGNIGLITYNFTPYSYECATSIIRIVQVNPLPINTIPPDLNLCDDNQDGIAIFNLSSQTPSITQGSGNNVQYFETQTDALAGINPISNSSSYSNIAPFNQTIFYKVTNSSNCSSTGSFTLNVIAPAMPIGIGYSIVNNTGNQIITVEIEGNSTYEYSLDSGDFQSSEIFENVAVGFHTIVVSDIVNGCSFTLTNIEVTETETPAPDGITSQTFNQGATLANFVVIGSNIQWYENENSTSGRFAVADVPLPLNTVLVNGTTYYASQKIGGYESISRLAVTATIMLSNHDFELTGVSFNPNPVQDYLTIQALEIISKVAIFNTLGQLISENNFNSISATLDFNIFSSGTYFVKIQSNEKSKVIKILKK